MTDLDPGPPTPTATTSSAPDGGLATTPGRPDPARPRRVATARAGRQLTPRRLAETAAAMAVAIVVAAGLRHVAHWHSTLAIGIAAYLAFVATLVIAQSRQANPHPVAPPPRSTQRVIDLTDGADARGTLDHLRIVDPETAFVRSGARSPSEGPTAAVDDDRAWLRSDPAGDPPRRRVSIDPGLLTAVGVAVVAAVGVALTLRALLAWSGILGTAMWGYLAFLAVFYAIVRDREDPQAASDRVVTLLIWSIGGVVIGVLGWMITYLFVRGVKDLTFGFLTQDLSKVGPLDSGGGARHAIIGTFEQVGIATLFSVPVAVMTAVYLHEIKGRLSVPVRFIVDAMSGLPSIVAGLLVFTVWVNGRGFSGIAGSAALGVLMLPTITRTSEEILRTIPDSLREASLALGAPQWRLVLRVVLPTALSGLVTATILGVARAVGETAPMLLTAFGADTTNVNPTKGPQSDLPLFVWKLIRVPNKAQNDRAWTGALVLVLIVLILFTTARFVTSRSRKRLGSSR